MRPTKLVVAGLHSYRDPVTVDFEELGRHGLFGIFGPIGSGKSTLLDAMTLALFGLVDRVVTRSRQGLIHLGSQRCEVKLQFTIDSRERQQHYEVQRAYRLKDKTAQRTLSRLVEYTPTGPAVIADKERDVNEAVIELIGLGPEDFMRAVVLPQGKFLELLHLKGSERRQMLQRIFRLHAYGGRLRRQIAARQQQTDQQLAAVRGELRGLGDASDEALKLAKERAKEAQRVRLEAQAQRTRQQQIIEQTRRLREEHARLAEARAELAAHQRDEAAIRTLEVQLASAKALEPLTVPVERWTEARREHQLAEAEHTTASAEAVQSETLWTRARDGHQATLRDDATQRAPLQQRLRELDALQSLLDERATIDRELTEVATQRSEQEAVIVDAEAAWQDADAQVSEIDDKRKVVRRHLRRRRVKPEERERAQVAADAADQLDRAGAEERAARAAVLALRERVKEAEVASAAAEALAQAAVQALDEADGEVGRLEAEGAPDLDPLDVRRRLAQHDAVEMARQRAQDRYDEATSRVERLRRTLEVAVRDADEAQSAAQAEAAELPGQLAATLAPETACPVCGSLDHPAPATVPEGPAGAAQAAHERALATRASAEAAHGGAKRELAAAAKALDAASTRLEGLGTPDDAVTVLAIHEAWHLSHRSALARRQIADLAVARADGPLQTATLRQADLQEALDAAEQRLEAARQGEAAAWEAFHASRGDLTIFDVRNALIAIASRDREAEALQRDLDELDLAWLTAVQRRDAKQADREQARTLQLRLEERHTLLETRREGLKQPPDDLTATRTRLNGQLSALDVAAQQAAQQLDAATSQHREAEQRLATAKGRLDAAQRALRTARSDVFVVIRTSLAWPDDLGEPPDEAAAAIDESLQQAVDHWFGSGRDLADPEAVAVRVRAYRDAEVALTAKLAALDDGTVPDPEALSDATFNALVAAAEAHQSTLDQAIEEAVAAQQAVETMTARIPRVQTLDQQLTKAEAEAAQLGALAAVLRGDRFVEYVATDHLSELAARASDHLGALTDGRYALKLDDDTGFEIVDHHGGGAVRPVHTLSGGESFLTALSLALALSTQVQARSARPLGFFFLDEGFGTLDPEALDRVLSSIEHLRDSNRVIGLISHVPAVRERVPRYLWVHRSDDSAGSAVEMHDN